MDDITRRDAFQRAAAGGLLTALVPASAGAGDDPDPKKAPPTEKERVMALGMTEGEADCWVATAEAAGTFFALPELHPMDRQEVATAIHVIQNKLLGRPFYRRYTGKTKDEPKG